MLLNRNLSNKMQHLALMVVEVAAADHTAFCADIDLQSNYWLHLVHFPTMTVWPLHIAQPLRLAYGLILPYHCRSSMNSQPNLPVLIGPSASILIEMMAMTDHYVMTGCHYNCGSNQIDDDIFHFIQCFIKFKRNWKWDENKCFYGFHSFKKKSSGKIPFKCYLPIWFWMRSGEFRSWHRRWYSNNRTRSCNQIVICTDCNSATVIGIWMMGSGRV